MRLALNTTYRNINGLPLPGLDNQNTAARIERRRNNRFNVGGYAFALIRSATTKPINIHSRGMGEIACSVFRSKPVKLGRIKNISMGGFMFRYIDGEVQSKDTPVLDILMADCRFYLKSLRFRSISERLLPTDFSSGFIQMKQLHVEFNRLTSYQIDKLEYFIRKNISLKKRKS